MKSSRRIIFLLLALIVIAGLLYWQFFLKKPKPKKRTTQPKAKVERPVRQPRPTPLPRRRIPTPSPRPQPTARPQPTPGITPRATPRVPVPLPPGATPPPGRPPGSPVPTPTGQPGVPKAQSLQAETQPVIQISLGEERQVAEGSTLVFSEARVVYQGSRPLKYQWELVNGPKEKIEIQGADQPQARVIFGDLEQVTDFEIRLQVTDGLTQAEETLPLKAFPAQLKWVGQAGGAFLGIQHMGMAWVVAEGRALKTYSPDLEPETTIPLGFDLVQFFPVVGPTGKEAIYVQAPAKDWMVVQPKEAGGVQLSKLPMLGNKILKAVPFVLEQEPYFFALLENKIELWNLSDPRHPRLKNSLTTTIAKPLYFAFQGRHLYVADETSIHLIDFGSGQLVASVPSGGSITSLTTYRLGEKHYLLASIGVDRTQAGRKDYGLRFFEITANGRLGGEKRLAPEDGTPVENAWLIPGVNLVLLHLTREGRPQLGLWDLASAKELPLKFDQPPNFAMLSDLATGKIGEKRVAVIADGNQLRVFQFQAAGSPPTEFQVSGLMAFPGILDAVWVQALATTSTLWVGDAGAGSGGSLTQVEGGELKVQRALNAGGWLPVSGTFPGGEGGGIVLYREAQAGPATEPQALGGLGWIHGGEAPEVSRSKPFLGILNEQGEIVPLGLDATRKEGKEQIGVALSRQRGSLGGAGLVLLEKPAEQALATFLAQDLASVGQLIPLQDARDVVMNSEGTLAFLAGGVDGVVAVDLIKKAPVARMSLGTKEWVADRVLLSHDGQILLASFVQGAKGQVLVKAFGVQQGGQLQELGNLVGVQAITSPIGPRAPRMALTQDDLYLFTPLNASLLGVYNLTNPGQPLKIAELKVPGILQGVSIAGRFKDVFLALGRGGIGKVEFGF